MSANQINELNSMFAQLSAILFIALSFVVQVIPNLDIISKIMLLFISLIYVGVIPWYVFYYIPYYISKPNIQYVISIKQLGLYLLLVFVAGAFMLLLVTIFAITIIMLVPVLVVILQTQSSWITLLALILYLLLSIVLVRYLSKHLIFKLVERIMCSKFSEALNIFKNTTARKALITVHYYSPMIFIGYLLVPVLNRNKTYYIEILLNDHDPYTILIGDIFTLSFVVLIITAFLIMKIIGDEIQKHSETNINPKNTQEINGGAKQRGRAAR